MQRENKNLSVEELLKIIENESNEDLKKRSNRKDDVLAFVTAHGIESGSIKVSSSILYRLYKFWSEDPLTIQKFSKKLKFLIDSTDKFFLVNKHPQNISLLLQPKERERIHPLRAARCLEFIQNKGLRRGTTYIEAMILYYLFCDWLVAKKVTRPINQITFMAACKLAFNIKKVDKVLYLGINQNIRDSFLTIEKEEAIKRKLYGKKAYSERQKKIRSPRSKVQLKDQARAD